MFEWKEEERPHPLYPKVEQTYRKIHLYPPKECDLCANVSHEVEYHEVSKTESSSMWVTPGTSFTIRVEWKKLCKRCHTLETSSLGVFG